MKDYYSILGIADDSTESEIKQSYRKLAKIYHPDRGGDTSKFQEIQEAYSVLGDPKKRQRYDYHRKSGVQFGDFGEFTDLNFSDFFDKVSRRKTSVRKNPIRVNVAISVADMATRSKKIVSFNNSGKPEYVEIDIPSEIPTSGSVRYPRIIDGEQDLIVCFSIDPDDKWKLDGLDVTIEQTVKIWDLILGTNISVFTIHGKKINVVVPVGTQSHTTMRVKKQGIEDSNGNKGDMYIKIIANIPKDIPDPLRQTIEFYKDQSN